MAQELVAVDFIVQEMLENNLSFWSINKGKRKYSENDNKNISTSDSVKLLVKKLKDLNGAGEVLVIVSEFPKANRRGTAASRVLKYLVNVDDKEIIQKMDISGISNELDKLRAENMQLKEKLISQAYEQKLEALEKKIEGLQQPQEEDHIGRVVDLVIPILSNMLLNPPPPAAPINGLAEETLLDEWCKIDKDAPKVLQAIVNLAKRSPITYSTYKPLILQNG